jgi:hypothetical protein
MAKHPDTPEQAALRRTLFKLMEAQISHELAKEASETPPARRAARLRPKTTYKGFGRETNATRA